MQRRRESSCRLRRSRSRCGRLAMASVSWRSGSPAAAAIWAGDDFEEVAVWILEIDSAPTVVVIDCTFLFLRGVSPIGQLPIAHPAEDRIELGLADQESIVLR